VVLTRYHVEPDRSHEDDEEERLGGACWRVRKGRVRVRSLEAHPVLTTTFRPYQASDVDVEVALAGGERTK
jgi:hypothetical protein